MCVCLCVSSGCSAEDCPLYCAHGQTQLALLQRGAPLLKLRLSLSLKGRWIKLLSFILSVCVCVCVCVSTPSHFTFLVLFPGGTILLVVGQRMDVMSWACSFFLSFPTKLLHDMSLGGVHMLTPQLSFAWSVSKSNIHLCNMNVIRGNMMSQNPNTSEFRMNSVRFSCLKWSVSSIGWLRAPSAV